MAERIPWTNMARVPQITKDFYDGRGEIVRLLGGDWRDSNAVELVKEKRQSFKNPANLGDAIRLSYGETKIPEAVDKNLNALNSQDTLAIVTGQQLGLFGGPLLTYYKALTAIFLARKLESDYKTTVVPIFWMETGDADYSEVNRTGFPPDGDDPRRAVYTLRDIVSGKSVHHHILTPEIDIVRDEIMNWLNSSPHRKRYGKIIGDCYQSGTPIVDAFRKLFTSLLGSMGLVMFDALDSNIVDISKPFWRKCVERPESLNNAFSVSSREVMAMRLPLQVRLRTNTLPIFSMDEDGIRHRLIGHSDAWQKGTNSKTYSNTDLKDMAEDAKNVFSPAVLLRPLLQDWLLPTWIYVGGPSEIAYQAQIGRAYDQINLPRPLIAPRISATLVERPVRRWLDKNNWKVIEVLGGKELLLRTTGSATSLGELFDTGSAHLRGWLARIQQQADIAGIDISRELDQSGRKLGYQWAKLLNTTMKKVSERDEARVSHAQRLQNHLFPENILQERQFNFLHYLARYGNQLVQAIDSEKDMFHPQHIVIDLEQER
ncbi:MAG: bacillithiol biosynthesis cysteine-adding enzyme BshC [SAR324 cluster bacterium]|nr:bacillithiol biosynthesis cysteine-adding enzyme BshC [SAR324 cluster bacterium]